MGCLGALLSFVLLWRLPDYLMIGAIVIVAALVGAKVRPHCRPFRWDDASIGYPIHPNTFPMYSVIVAVVGVAVLFIVGEVVTRWRRPLRRAYRRAHDVGWLKSMLLHVNGWVLVQLYSVILAFAIVNLAKLYAGRLRPDFLARLAAEGFTDNGSFNSMVASGKVCDAARDGRLSFPSGHAGTIFAGFVPPVLYLMGLTRQLHAGASYAVLTLCLLPLILPVTVAISRTVDYRHNFDDVLCGAVIGSACGVLAVVFSFRGSDTGEWTLRAHPVMARDYHSSSGSGGNHDDDDDDDDAEGEAMRDGSNSGRAGPHGAAGAARGGRKVLNVEVLDTPRSIVSRSPRGTDLPGGGSSNYSSARPHPHPLLINSDSEADGADRSGGRSSSCRLGDGDVLVSSP